MTSINFDTGIRTYVINGDENNVIAVNIADANLMYRMEKAEKQIESILSNEMTPDAKTVYEADRQLKAVIDEAFNADISSHVFGGANCMSPVGNGDTLFESFFNAFIPVIKKDHEAYQAKRRDKVNSYVATSEELA